MSATEQSPVHNNRGATITANVATSYLRFAVTLVSMLLLTPFIIRHLGEDDYGLWTLVLCCVGYLELLECGLGSAVVKYFGQYQAAGDNEGRNRLASTLLVIYSGIALICLSIAVGLSFFFDDWFSIPAAQASKSRWVLLLLTARLCLNLPLGLFYSLLFGAQRISALNVVKTCCSLGYALTVWWALSSGFGIVAQAVLNSSWLLVEHLIFAWLCRRNFPDLKIRLRYFDRTTFQRVAAFSGFAMLTNIGSIIILRTDPIIVSLHLPLAAVAIYALAMKMSEQVMLLAKQMVNVFTPLFAELHGAGRRDEIRKVFLWYSKATLIATFGAVIPLTIYADHAVVLWVGKSFQQAGPILMILAITVVARIMQAAATNVIAMTGHHRFIAIIVAFNALGNVVLSAALAPVWGLLGVAFGTLVSTFTAAVVLIGKTCHENDVNARQYVSATFKPLLAPVFVHVLVCSAWAGISPPVSLLEMLLEVIACGLAYGLFVWNRSLAEEERNFIQQRLPRRLRGMLALSFHEFIMFRRTAKL